MRNDYAQINNHNRFSSSTPPPPSSAYDYNEYTSRRGERSAKPAAATTKKRPVQQQRRGGDEDEEFDEDSFHDRRRRKEERKAEKERLKREALEQAGPVPIFLPEYISVANLGLALGVKQHVFLAQLAELGFEDISKESILQGETAALVAQEYGFEPTVDVGEEKDLKPRPTPEDTSALPQRPPVVTIMGHVDHGKTTLLDYLRKSSVAAGEHGGITQHIGAFSVRMSSGRDITFLDTPGHAAFLKMRQRGANVTDIVILVVAADDSVKPQTLEALKHARAAKVPMIVAITKVDKSDANVDRVKSDLAAQGVEIEDYGGDVQVVSVSGKTGAGMDDLEETILLQSDMMDIRAETDGMAEGWVLESSIKPIGRVATVLVKRGTLRPGDFIAAGMVYCKIRSLRNEAGVEVDEAPPGTAVEILGWKDPPDAGDMVLQAPSKDKAEGATRYRQELKDREEDVATMAVQGEERREREREAAEKAEMERREKGNHRTGGSGGGEVVEKEGKEKDGREEENKTPGTQLVNFTVKGDVHGSVEAVCASVMEIGNNEVRPRVLLSSTGQVTESDVEHAATSGSSIINFNNPVSGHIKRLADDAGVKIIDHNIIYHLAEEVRDMLSALLPPNISIKVVGEAEILQVFPINIKGRVYRNIAGCRVRNGLMTKNAKCRIMRGGEVVFEGAVENLKHGKRNVTEMRKGAECGISFPEFDDFKQGDNIQAIEEIKEKRTL
ncbi:mitochondrial translation initiation factor 2 [Bombardia bombarda]|uniref:Translation initiation factor IF-2, mitochondrial n=1 Tax=Bombardia bombarda TaxID=252184 RepID=A0AA40C538_9PEZI|nr:mitochondrial translation initiation factor 2 [Bombardia bombarda]